MTSTSAPQLASIVVLARADGALLLLRHAAGPFAGRWSPPLVGVAEDETAEDALARLLRQALRVEHRGSFDFLDTLAVDGGGGEPFVVNAFACGGWSGEPMLVRGAYDDAVWAPAEAMDTLNVLPELRAWLLDRDAAASSGEPTALAALLDAARAELVAAFEAVPPPGRAAAVEVLAEIAARERYGLAETQRLLAEPGAHWRAFNGAQWSDLRALQPAEDEADVRARLDAARSETLRWLAGVDAQTLCAYGNHEERGVVRVGEQIAALARHDRDQAAQLRRLAAAAARGAHGRVEGE